MNEGANLRAIDHHGRTPSLAAWKTPLPTRQALVLLWYRALRMCNLDPAELDADRYDSRFDIVLGECCFCAPNGGSTTPTGDYVICPWCCITAYTGQFETRNHWRGSTNRAKLGLLLCCPTAVCPVHIHRYRAEVERGGLLLPKESGGILSRVEKCVDSACEVCFRRVWVPRFKHYKLSPCSKEEAKEADDDKGVEIEGGDVRRERDEEDTDEEGEEWVIHGPICRLSWKR
ncbi:hypothetical protein BZA05DRAFT_244274 [Tricharina praecox]|uniref:uncharacterized protein n=1 Tax=Tricharina praecox TaxID=43433 RepID=UPI00221F3AEE|nr:uncharacterized protein BZA05DRAFT_244274 [Tricharina praecox]KAI5854544.1 hypothetical protein BZA05DRAFT_244274 [Tricharina praecox]